MLAFFLIFGLCLSGTVAVPCQFRPYGDSGVCVCNEDICDTLEYVWPSNPMEYVFYTTSMSGDRFKATSGNFTENIAPTISHPSASTERLSINRSRRFQRMTGWGMAMTGAVSYNLARMTPQLRSYVYRDYYSRPYGCNFNWLRMPIGGCDFDFEPWQYNTSPINDTELTDFEKLNPYDVPKVQQIADLKNISGIGDDLKIMFSAWSPPPWMKTNNAFSGFSLLLEQYYATWALFHIKYMRLMKRHNLTAYAITTGNEPSNGLFLSRYVHFLCLGWRPGDQGRWIREHLGPAVRESEFADVKIFVNDDQRVTLIWWLTKVGQEAMEYVDGVAVHWYADRVTPPQFLDWVAEHYPDKLLMNTESSSGSVFFDTPGVMLGSWGRAEFVFERIMQDLRHHVIGWIEWNMVLDTKGGPNYACNNIDALIIFNETAMEYYKQPWFYVFGHFSKFIPEGSVRIGADFDAHSRPTRSTVLMVAYETPNGTISLVLANKGETEATVIVTDVQSGRVANISLVPRSINTMIYS